MDASTAYLMVTEGESVVLRAKDHSISCRVFHLVQLGPWSRCGMVSSIDLPVFTAIVHKK